MTVSQTFLVFDDLDNFEKYWSGVLYKFLNWGLPNFILMIRLGYGFWKERNKIPLSLYLVHITVKVIYIC